MPLTCDAVLFDLDGVLVDSNAIAVAATLPPSALTDADIVLARLADLEVDVRPASLEVGWTTALHARDGAMYTGPS